MLSSVMKKIGSTSAISGCGDIISLKIDCRLHFYIKPITLTIFTAANSIRRGTQ
jgi:hypothetical protein